MIENIQYLIESFIDDEEEIKPDMDLPRNVRKLPEWPRNNRIYPSSISAKGVIKKALKYYIKTLSDEQLKEYVQDFINELHYSLPSEDGAYIINSPKYTFNRIKCAYDAVVEFLNKSDNTIPETNKANKVKTEIEKCCREKLDDMYWPNPTYFKDKEEKLKAEKEAYKKLREEENNANEIAKTMQFMSNAYFKLPSSISYSDWFTLKKIGLYKGKPKFEFLKIRLN